MSTGGGGTEGLPEVVVRPWKDSAVPSCAPIGCHGPSLRTEVVHSRLRGKEAQEARGAHALSAGQARGWPLPETRLARELWTAGFPHLVGPHQRLTAGDTWLSPPGVCGDQGCGPMPRTVRRRAPEGTTRPLASSGT